MSFPQTPAYNAFQKTFWFSTSYSTTLVMSNTTTTSMGWSAKALPEKSFSAADFSTPYSFLGFDVSFSKAGSIYKNSILFSLAGVSLWVIEIANPDDFQKVSQAFQLTLLGYSPLRESLEQTLLAVSATAPTSYVYDNSLSVVANYYKAQNFKPNGVSNTSNSGFDAGGIDELVQFLSRRVGELELLSEEDYSVNRSTLTQDQKDTLDKHPFFFGSLNLSQNVFKGKSKNFTLPTNRYTLDGEEGSILSVCLSNPTGMDLTKEQAVALNILSLAQQNSKAAFVYDILRAKDGGVNYAGEPIPDPLEVLTNIGVDTLIGKDATDKIAATLNVPSDFLYKAALQVPTALAGVVQFDPMLRKRFKSLSDFWGRFLN